MDRAPRGRRKPYPINGEESGDAEGQKAGSLLEILRRDPLPASGPAKVAGLGRLESGIRIHSLQREVERADRVSRAGGAAAAGAGDGEGRAQLPHPVDRPRPRPDLIRGCGAGVVHEVREGENQHLAGVKE
ncbi:unnamed protein product [Linum trigynum]